MYPYYLAHYGVKGMKWGVRKEEEHTSGTTKPKAKKNSYAPNYSAKQRKRDERIYGKKAVERINKRMLAGESIQSARHAEVGRRKNKIAGKNITRNVAKTSLEIGGAAGVTSFLAKKGLTGTPVGNIIGEISIGVGKQFINMLIK